MDNVENKSVPQTESSEWRAYYESIHHLVVSVMILLIVVSGTLWIFLRWQVKYLNLELEGIRPQATNFIAQYEKSTKPAMDNFVNKLSEYGRTHPDFAPIMTKYSIKPAGTPSIGPATSAPPVAPAKKK